MAIELRSACRAGRAVTFSYAGIELIHRFSEAGSLQAALDCFAGASAPLTLAMADGWRHDTPVVANDLGRATKVALSWRGAADLDLHVYEASARAADPGHVWSGAPSSLQAAKRAVDTGAKAHGFLSSSAQPGGQRDRLEVYTLLLPTRGDAGVVDIAVDFASRGDVASGEFCGDGSSAEVAFKLHVSGPDGRRETTNAVMRAAPCGMRIAPEVRFDRSLLPRLRWSPVGAAGAVASESGSPIDERTQK